MKLGSELPIHARPIPQLPFVRGYVEALRPQERGLLVGGWMVLPDQPMDAV